MGGSSNFQDCQLNMCRYLGPAFLENIIRKRQVSVLWNACLENYVLTITFGWKRSIIPQFGNSLTFADNFSDPHR